MRGSDLRPRLLKFEFLRRYYRSPIGHLRTYTVTAIYEVQSEGNHRRAEPTLADRNWEISIR